MKPNNLRTRIFVDGGDPAETQRLKERLGFIDGQTTNPTLISQHPEAAARLARGEKLSAEELLEFYRHVVTQFSELIPDGSVSIEVYADHTTTADEMLTQAKTMFSWISNAHIKFPTTEAGLEAAERATAAEMRVNMTLCFSQSQAAAVYAATRGAKRGDVFVSPFAGRLDDRGENGMDLIANIKRMYADGDGHVELLAASIRSIDHLQYALALGCDIATVPVPVLDAWADAGMPVPETFAYQPDGLTPIPYEELPLDREWRDYDISHELTTIGIAKFSNDWNALIDSKE